MGRKTQITKEQLLEAGFQIILREGHAGISVKSVAAELGISTTPILWTFDNIENYRKELRSYVWAYLNRKMEQSNEGADRIYRLTGGVCVDLAIDEPHLLRYLRSGPDYYQASGSIEFLDDDNRNQTTRKGCATALDVSEAQARAFIQFVNTYTEGLISLILEGVVHPTKEEAHRQIREAGIAYTIFLKASEGKTRGTQS